MKCKVKPSHSQRSQQSSSPTVRRCVFTHTRETSCHCASSQAAQQLNNWCNAFNMKNSQNSAPFFSWDFFLQVRNVTVSMTLQEKLGWEPFSRGLSRNTGAFVKHWRAESRVVDQGCPPISCNNNTNEPQTGCSYFCGRSQRQRQRQHWVFVHIWDQEWGQRYVSFCCPSSGKKGRFAVLCTKDAQIDNKTIKKKKMD